MVLQTVSGYFRRNRDGRRKFIKRHKRTRRSGLSKRRTISSKPVRLFQVRDDFGQIRGFSSRPPKRRK